jgi:hypothetical protein
MEGMEWNETTPAHCQLPPGLAQHPRYRILERLGA